MKPEDFLAELKGITSKLEAGLTTQDAAQTSEPAPAAVAVVTDVRDVATKGAPGAGGKPDNKGREEAVLAQKQAQYAHRGELVGSFIKLASADKAYAHLASDEVLSDPIAYLRKKEVDRNGRSRYVVKDAELEGMIQTALRVGARKDGVPFETWAAGDMNKIGAGLERAAGLGAFGKEGASVVKALDTGTAPALIRTDIEPLIHEAYLRSFPAAEAIQSFPANGLKHTYNRRTAIGNAVTLAELGDLTGADAQSTFGQAQNSNIAVLASKRNISLKLQYAIAQSGMRYNPEQLEIMAAITSIAKKNQTLMLQGNISDAAGTASTESGAYDANGYDGLRYILNAAGAALTKAPGDTYVKTINKAVAQIANAGGNVEDLLILLSYGVRIAINEELQNYLQINDRAPGSGAPSNLSANGLVTVSDWPAQMTNVPAGAQTEGIGYYTKDATEVEDINIIDPMGLGFAYLGSPNPVLLELPIGYNNALSNVYISFLMNGLVAHIPTFHRKARVPKQTV